MNLAIPLLALILANGTQKASAATKARTPIKGAKSGRTWFVVDSVAGASKTPVRDVFAAATGNELVISFAVLGGMRARLYVSPSTLAPVALNDFDVSSVQAGKL